jgi:hypothetical protein
LDQENELLIKDPSLQNNLMILCFDTLFKHFTKQEVNTYDETFDKYYYAIKVTWKIDQQEFGSHSEGYGLPQVPQVGKAIRRASL